MTTMIQAFYPECLKTLFIINCPWYFTAIYSIFKPFIDKKTATKFQLLGTNFIDTLSKFIDRSEIPADLGTIRSLAVFRILLKRYSCVIM
jgi:quinol-cytochrome oxidoreductase complex cytochrome b subunit